MTRFLLALGTVLFFALPVFASAQVVPFETLALSETSGCTRPAQMLINNEADWQRVWRVHGGQGIAPSVNWREQRVVALLGGAQGAGAKLELLRAVREGDALTLYVWRENGEGHKSTQPVHFAAVSLLPDEKVAVRFADASTMSCSVCVR